MADNKELVVTPTRQKSNGAPTSVATSKPPHRGKDSHGGNNSARRSDGNRGGGRGRSRGGRRGSGSRRGSGGRGGGDARSHPHRQPSAAVEVATTTAPIDAFTYIEGNEVVSQTTLLGRSPTGHPNKKGVSINHLIDFKPRVRQKQPVIYGGSKRSQSRSQAPLTPYNREQYMQVNCQFHVRAGRDYTKYLTSPDKMVEWDDVDQVGVSCTDDQRCPICLGFPVAPKITRCGHVYCWNCILHHMSTSKNNWQSCAICEDFVYERDLRSVHFRMVTHPKLEHKFKLELLKRHRGSTMSVVADEWQRVATSDAAAMFLSQDLDKRFFKIIPCGSKELSRVYARERRELCVEIEDCGAVVDKFLLQALATLEKQCVTLAKTPAAFKDDFSLMLSANLTTGGDRQWGSKPFERRRTESSTSICSTHSNVSDDLDNVGSPVLRDWMTEEEEVVFDTSRNATKRVVIASTHTPSKYDDDVGWGLDTNVGDDDEISAELSTLTSTTTSTSTLASPSTSTSTSTPTSSELGAPSRNSSNNEVFGRIHTLQASSKSFTPMTTVGVNASPAHVTANNHVLAVQPPPSTTTAATTTTTTTAMSSTTPTITPTSSTSKTPTTTTPSPATKSTTKPSTAVSTVRDEPGVYSYLQAADGQFVFIHSLNLRCLIKEYGSIDNCPSSLEARVVEITREHMTRELRSRFRYLAHLPLSCEFAIIELDLHGCVSSQTLAHFAKELGVKRAARKKKVQQEKNYSRKMEQALNHQQATFLSTTSLSSSPSDVMSPAVMEWLSLGHDSSGANANTVTTTNNNNDDDDSNNNTDSTTDGEPRHAFSKVVNGGYAASDTSGYMGSDFDSPPLSSLSVTSSKASAKASPKATTLTSTWGAQAPLSTSAWGTKKPEAPPREEYEPPSQQESFYAGVDGGLMDDHTIGSASGLTSGLNNMNGKKKKKKIVLLSTSSQRRY